MGDLSRAMNDKVLRRMAGDLVYEMGRRYFAEGRVRSIEATSGGVKALVCGTETYNVILKDDEGVLDYECACDIGEEGFFCKHCVAAGLAWLAPPKPVEKSEPGQLPIDEAVGLFLSLERERQARMLTEWARDDERLVVRLMAVAAALGSPEQTLAALRTAVLETLDPDRFEYEVEWLEAGRSTIDLIEVHAERGPADDVIVLCEDALDRMTVTLLLVGEPSAESDELLEILQDIHYEACVRARPDPEALAERLFQWEMRSVYDIFFQAAERYQKVLGQAGLRRFRELAEAAWKKRANRPNDPETHTLQMLLELLAGLGGDIEAQIEIMARDLSSSDAYLRIANLCFQSGEPIRAMEWAERGIRAFPNDPRSRLPLLAAVIHQDFGRLDQSVQVLREAFDRNPGQETAVALRMFAEPIKQWLPMLDDVVKSLRRKLAAISDDLEVAELRTLIIALLVDAGRDQEAWDESRQGPYHSDVKLGLAAKMGRKHPEECARIFLAEAGRQISQEATVESYKAAMAMLEKAASLMNRIGKDHEFLLELQAIQSQHKRKKKLLELIEKRRPKLYLKRKR